MIKRSQIIKLIFLLLLLPYIGASQGLDHKLGEILVQFDNKASPVNFFEEIENLSILDQSNTSFELVSKSMNIWNLAFDPNQFHEGEILNYIKNQEVVINAQLNYFVSDRNLPDDPFFPSSWHLKNDGQTGGTPGVDLDAALAWTLTTGGITLNGDTIVICIIDQGFDIDHEDLVDNLWVNHDEIPGDLIDNDNNGFIDDYLGWDVNTESDDIGTDIPSNWHGTAVSGIAGAKGDNSTGVTGICWNVKLMLVKRGDATDDAIAAYDYALSNRKLYNESLGQQGAFVVATNSSWGIDYGTPDEAPLWCAMYDSLGAEGILNAAATTNTSVDVDEVGDLPTTCTSDFLIAVTSVDHNDEIMPNAGFGVQSIDLGAFGQNIFSIFNNDGYGQISGTSAAAPQVAGTIGLLCSAPCPSFSALAKSNPQLAALQLKGYILDGTEANSSLENITVTGGRLNINNSLQLLMDECDYSGCFAPYSIGINEITDSSALIEWFVEIATMSVNLRYRQTGATEWIIVNDVLSPFMIEGLNSCTSYEFQLQSVCDGVSSSYTASFSFQTDGCCSPPGFINTESFSNSISLDWEEITAAIGYILQYRETGATNWMEIDLVENFYTLTDLISCQEYEFQIRTACTSTNSIFSPIYSAATSGCGACTDFDYCPSSGPDDGFFWISEVIIADLENPSGNSMTGYTDFTNLSATLIQGFVHEFEINTDFDLFEIPSYFNIWIDINQDGAFDNGELLFQSPGQETSASGIIFIPPSALLGSTRMRVSFMEEISGPCGSSMVVGEVEDYCVDIIEPTECLPPVNLNHITTQNSAHLVWSGNLLIDEYLLTYRELGTQNWFSENTFANNFNIENLNSCTDYEYFLTSICDGETSFASAIKIFTTKGCGTCLDDNYCFVSPCIIDFEWIEKITVHDLVNASGPNGGYKHFTDQTTNLVKGEYYPVELIPGFSNIYYDELFYIWIDFNQDGVFDNSTENVFEGFSESANSVAGNILIPLDAVVGSTRMRISMKYTDPVAEPCESGFFGEIEEYCINILDEDQDICPMVQTMDFINIDSFAISASWLEIQDANAYKIRYRLSDFPNDPWSYITTANNYLILDEILACEDYDCQIQTICTFGISNFSMPWQFSTCDSVAVNGQDLSFARDKISIYPNPFYNQLTINFESDKVSDYEVTIFSGIGQRVKSIKQQSSLGSNTFQFETQDLTPGIYIINISIDDQSILTQKIIHQAP